MAILIRDEQRTTVSGGVSNADSSVVLPIKIDSVTGRVLTTTAGGSGTVTEVDTGTGLTGGPITTTGTVALDTKLAPMDTLTGNSLKYLRVNVGETAVEYASAPSVSLTIGSTTISSGTNTRILYDNAGTLGEYTLTGTGTVVVMATSPTLVTPVLGVATATSINKMAISAPATSSTLAVADGKTLTANATTTFAGTDGKTLTISNSGTLAGGDAFVLAIAAAKTLTVSNTLTFTGTDSSSVAFGAGGTVLYANQSITLSGDVTGSGSTAITTTVAKIAGTTVSGTTGTTNVVFSGSPTIATPTITTSATVPKIIGGSGTTGTQLTLQTTSGNGTTDALVIAGGNAGATTFATFTTGALTITTSGVFTTGTIELGAASDTTLSRSGAGVLAVEGVVIPSISSTNTLTNKRITRRVTTTNAPGATPTINTDNVDLQVLTGVGTAITSMTTNLSGTPVQGDFLEIDFLDDGTARAITWGTSFANGGIVSLPTTTVISTVLRVLLTYQTAASLNKWVCVAVA